MTMTVNDISNALYNAEREIERAETQTYKMAEMLKGRLRYVNQNNAHHRGELLAALKKELSSFNSKTHQWKD